MYKIQNEVLRTNLNIGLSVLLWIVSFICSAVFGWGQWVALSLSGFVLMSLLLDWVVWIVELIWFLPARIRFLFTGKKAEKAEEKAARERREAYQASVRKDEAISFVREIRDSK